jgi:predicted esterase YcpF (UPF0227 family)
VNVLYFHGFASSPASAKISALRPLLASRGIELITPDLNAPSFERLDWNAMIDVAMNAAREHPPRAIVGSSLGSLVALEVVRRGVIAPLVLIAPAVGVAHRWKTKVPDGDPVIVFNHALGHPATIHRAFIEQMGDVRVDEDAPPSRVVVIMGTDDDTVPFDLVEETWKRWEARGLAPGSKMITIEAGDHGLTSHVEKIANEIAAATQQ